MINLHNGDCLEVMKTIESGSVDAIITDPPYGTTACKWDSVIDFELMWEQLNRIIKPNGAIVLFGSEPFSSALRMSNIKNYKYDWIWEKNKTTGVFTAKKQPLKNHEIISVFYKKQCTYNFQKEDRSINSHAKKEQFHTDKKSIYGNSEVISKEVVKGSKSYPKTVKFFKSVHTVGKNKSVHPTQKPIALMEYLIKTYTNKNETVLDFTMGSGSTMVACNNLNRNGIGIEMDENYFNIATKRVKENEYGLFRN